MIARFYKIICAVCLLAAMVSCYTFTLIEQPHEAFVNSSFKVKLEVKRDGSTDQGFVMNVHGLFGVCVPEGWQAQGDIVMTQVAKETTDLGDPDYNSTITRSMMACDAYTALLNRDYPKVGYTWLGFATDAPFKSMFNAQNPDTEVESISVEFSIRTNDLTGVFYLDYIAGQVEPDKFDQLGEIQDDWNTKTATFKADHIGNVANADTRIVVTNRDGSIDEGSPSDPILEESWQLELIEGDVRPGTAYAYKDKKYDELFTRTSGWNGGDGVLTVGLPNGDVFWTFNDSFYGTVSPRTRSRGNCSFPRNSIMVQKAHDGIPGEEPKDFVWLADYVNWTDQSKSTYMNARTHLRHPLGEKTDAEIAAGEIDQGKVYWSGDGRIYDGKLQMIWIAVESAELRNLGTSLATYSLDGSEPKDYYTSSIPDYLPHEGDYLYRESEEHQINDNAVSYGSTLWEDEDGHTYLYATKGYVPVVARTGTEDLYSDWEYYVKDAEGDGWSWQDEYPTDEEMDRSSIMANGYQLSMPWVFKDGDYYYMTAQAPFFSREVYIYRSESPVGPFDEKHLVLMLPDHIDKKGDQKYHWLYMVNLHPALSRQGELVFTTNTDPDDFWDNFNAVGSADYYRPYFYRVYHWKTLYGIDDRTSSSATESISIDSFAESEINDPAYYNLQGIKVTNPAGGIFIHKGKKILIK
ncbi:MAG: DUF5005 domain-containing protein [Bacteroidales bacterium]|nr:DUF5005 domain-containing protein [Bacteroidales bacterium]